MKTLLTEETLKVPKGVKITIKSKKVEVKGKHGDLTRDFKHLPIELYLGDGGKKVIARMYFAKSKQCSMLNTVCSHISNLFDGVQKKFEYKMRLVYAHFPINLNFRDDAMSIAGIGVAASTLNLADVVWMLPFLVGTAGVCSAAFFAIISQLWATLVVCLYIGGGLEEWSNNRYVDYMIGVIALAFALMQLMQENCHCVKDRDVNDDESNKHPAERFSLGAFALLTVVATFDQVLVYVPLLKREGVTCADLEVGILLATLVTFLICYIATKIPGVLNILKEIPIWLPALFVGVASICEGLLGF